MADNSNNPIKYSDLVAPDNSIKQLIAQLDEMSDAYTNALRNIKAEAIQLTAILQKNSGATEAGRMATKKAADDADKLARAQRELSFAESENAKKLAELKQATKEQSDINKLIIKINQSAEGSYNKLSAQYSLNKIYLNNMTVAERENTNEGKKLVTQTKDMYEEMNRLQKATGKSQLNVGNYPQLTNMLGTYTNKLTEAIGIQGNFGSSLASMASRGDSGKTIFTSMATGVEAFGKTLLGLMANPIFIAIAGITGAGLAVKWWYDYNTGLIEASRLTKAFTGKQGDDMRSYRDEVQAVGDAFGSDFKETLVSTTALQKDFGITSEEALKDVKDGFLTGANVSGDFLNQIKQYGPVFKNMGVSASDFIAILSQTNKMGVPADRVLGLYSMADKKIREMGTTTKAALNGIGIDSNKLEKDLSSGSKTTFDAMKMVSEQISKLPKNSSEAGQAIRAVFGKNGAVSGLEFIKSIKDMQGGLDGLKSKMGELGKLRDENIKKQAELNTVIASLFDMTGGGFETLIARGKLFITNVLLGMIKGVVSFINYFIQLYNDSLLFRSLVQAIITDFSIMWNVVKSLFTYMINNLKILSIALHGAFTFDFTEITKAWKMWGENNNKLVKNIIKGTVQSFKDGFNGLDKKIKPINLKVNTTTTTTSTTKTTTTKGGTVEKVETDAERAKRLKQQEAARKKEEAERKKRLADAEKTYKNTIDLQRKEQDAELELMTDGFDKQRIKTNYEYNRQIQDLNHQLITSKNLNKAGREAITETIAALEQKRTADLLKIEQDRQLQELDLQKQGIQLRLSAVQSGSEQEKNLKLQLIENERKAALLQNKQKPVEQQQSETDINASYNAQTTPVYDTYMQAQLKMFDQQQALSQSEFDLLKTTEERKTRFKLQAEKERLQKVLELNKIAGTKLSDLEIETINNQIKLIDKNISESQKKEDNKDIYSMMGLNLDDNQKDAINTSVSFATDQLNTLLAARVEATQAAVESSNKQVDSAQKALDVELQARANGYSNNVVMAQKELDLAKKNQEKALKEQAKAQKAQAALQTVQQIGNLITSSTLIWSQLGFPWAIPAIAVMWGSFAATKIKAAQVTKQASTESYGEGTVELLSGGSHQSNTDIDFGTKEDGTKRRAEGGEFFAVINKRNSRKFRKFIPGIINSLNDGSFANKYLNAYNDNGGMSINVQQSDPDIAQLKDDVRDIKNQYSRKIYVDSQGNTIEVYKNLKRKIKK